MEDDIVAIVKFPHLSIHSATLDEYGGETPRTVFEIRDCSDGKEPNLFSCYYPEADEHFDNFSIEAIAKDILDFLDSDEVVMKTGKFEIEKINPKVVIVENRRKNPDYSAEIERLLRK